MSQVSDAACRKLTQDEIDERFVRQERQYGKGKKLSPEEEPTESQFAAIKYLLEVGENSTLLLLCSCLLATGI